MTKEVHYTEYDMDKWRWPSFTPYEIRSKGDGLLLINGDAMDKLQAFRDALNIPFSPNSAYRSEEHNRNVGGAPKSMHREGRAFDIPLKNGITRDDVKRIAQEVGFTGIGDYNTFVHIDTGRKRYWDKR